MPSLASSHNQNALYAVREDFSASLHKNYLQMLVVYFAMQDFAGAETDYHAWQADEQFCASDYWQPGAHLINAWQTGDGAAWQQTVQSSAFKYLDNHIARLAAKLTLGAARGAPAAEAKSDASQAAETLV